MGCGAEFARIFLGTSAESIPARIPYITPDPNRVVFWREELGKLPGRKIGLVWQGSTEHAGDRWRSIPLKRLRPLTELPGITWCSLQKGPGRDQLQEADCQGMDIIDLGAKTSNSFADTAALLSNLDRLISVDTSVAHVAGALGAPCWLLIPFAPDWRWLQDGEMTSWYPGTRLLRQANRGEWEEVVERIGQELKA